jgi:magnesium-transporting ATPase (P-type)
VYYLYWYRKYKNITYLGVSTEFNNEGTLFVVLMSRWTLVLAQIPISLNVHIEIVRIIQSFILERDPILAINSNSIRPSVYNHRLLESIG